MKIADGTSQRRQNLSLRNVIGRIGWLPVLLLALGLPIAGLAALRGDGSYTQEPINYIKATPTDAIAELQAKLDKGETQLKFDGKHGYLLSLLQALHVPVASQMLVFSKTSFQHERIAPDTPRALYFNDRVYVGWVQNGDYLEISSVDPQLGTVFYLLPQRREAAPKFVRQTYECLQCHDSQLAKGVPGQLMRSVYPDRRGFPILSAGTYATSDQSPLSERWGGWYVTGKHGSQQHMGNMMAKSETNPEATDWAAGGNITDLSRLFDTSPYLNKYSDIVALMTAEHQTQVQNLITRANFETRRALLYEQQLNKDLGRGGDYHSDSVQHWIEGACEPLVKAMLFAGEATLKAPITGTSGFAERFATYGPRDHQNRSLREFDLKRRLFRYPCSYQIYSAAFEGLPETAKNCVYRRFEEILTDADKTPTFSHLSATDRTAILEILRDTKPDFVTWEAKQKKA